MTAGGTGRTRVGPLDPIRYGMFRHRLYHILEEGRIAIQRVSGSPVVVEGGECMCSFYDASGTTILTACGLLLHCTGCSTAIERAIAWYGEDPGLHEGDQLFFNDPYIAATHVYDMLVIQPIFFEGQRIAWTGSMMHTADTGGVLRGGAREIFHEGLRVAGLKIMERGRLRPEVFRTLCQQVRDPDYMGLDLKARIAANNVCAQAYLRLVEQYGLAFVQAACQQLIDDAGKMARAKLRRLPDGTWRSRTYGLSHAGGERRPFKVVCTMTKQGETLTFDYTGTSPQNEDAANCTLSCSWSCLFVALAGHLFWEVPWNGGMVAPVRLIIPEGTLLNCRYPAACGLGPATGRLLTTTAHECIAKLLYAGGCPDDVTASWTGGAGGEQRRLGGHNQHGGVVAQQIYDFFAGGLGAAPYRDGVDTGANMLNPQSSISDVELIEMNYPLLYLSRNQARDSGGFGRFAGGLGMERLMMVYGSQDLSDNHWPPIGIPAGWGLFGGYPSNSWESIIFHSRDLATRLAQGSYPASFEELTADRGSPHDPLGPMGRVPLEEFDILADRAVGDGGCGFGDPLDREPVAVLGDVERQAVSPEVAEAIYGVVTVRDDRGRLRCDVAATEQRRHQLRQQRLGSGGRIAPLLEGGLPQGSPIHAYLEIVEGLPGERHIACRRCNLRLCGVDDNYKRHTLVRRSLLAQGRLQPLSPAAGPAAAPPVPAGQLPLLILQEYLCPGCATLFQVDTWCPKLDDAEPLWDIQIKP